MNNSRLELLIEERIKLAKIGIYTFLTHGIGVDGHCDCRTHNCPRSGKHPRFSGSDRRATIDLAQIRTETSFRSANIAIHCGLSNLVVVDIDPRNGGWETLAELEQKLGPLESEVVAETGGGGKHRYFRASPNKVYPSGLGPGVDLLSGSKYPIIPPSRHFSGLNYKWRDGCDPFDSAFLLSPLREAFFDIQYRPETSPVLAEPVEETDDNVARLRSALEFIPADCPRNEWRDHIFAINATGWHCAEEIARDWSMTAPLRWLDGAFAQLWESADPARPGGRTIASIYFIAKKNGWVGPPAGSRLETLGDIDNGRRFAERYRGKLIYDRASRAWRQYVEGIWRPCDSGEDIAAAKDIADTIVKETCENFTASPTEGNRKAHSQALRVHCSAQRVHATIEMAAAEPGMSVADPSTFDANPDILGVQGGAIDLRTGAWLPPSPNYRISKCVGVSYDPTAGCPRFEQFLCEILGSREEAAFVQRFAGYTLTGSVDEEALLFMQGQGANGKSVLANVLSGILGDYAATVGSELLAVTKHESEAARFKVRLRGIRMALVNEVGQNDTFNDQRVKEIVSREAISGRFLYGEAFDFMPTHKLWVRGNHRPAVLDSGDGMWRRIILLAFARQFTLKERVRDLDRQLLADEGSGILNWCIRGCLEWRKRTLAIPPSISRETAQYRDETDVVGEWMEAECKQSPVIRCTVTTIYDSYRSYFHEAGMSPKSQVAFTRMMGTRGFRRKSSNGKPYLEGIALAL